MDAEAAAHAWMDAWNQAWHAKDPDPLAKVYSNEVVFRSHPFRDPQAPLNYARAAFAEEGEELDLWWGDPIVDGDRAAVEYWAVLTEDGELVTLAGTSVLTFGADGLVVDEHDYWASGPGRIEPWAGWS